MATPTTFTPKNVDGVQLATTNTTLLTLSANTNGIKITSLSLTNISGTSQATGIYLSPSGVAPADTNIMLKGVPIPGDGVPYEFIPPQGKFLEASGTIVGTAAVANTITVHLAYIEFN